VTENFEAMIEALKQNGARLKRVQEAIERLLFGSGGPDDPSAAARVPRNRTPPTRTGALALEEPHDADRVVAVGVMDVTPERWNSLAPSRRIRCAVALATRPSPGVVSGADRQWIRLC
jgi:hypothetical protein